MYSPLVVGGTGGSGTRVVAQIVRGTGRYMGADLNDAEDSRLLGRFEWDWGLRYLEDGPTPEMISAFETALAEHLDRRPAGACWGWKHPHSYLLLPFLHARLPDLRFIHVVRDGRDIAFSPNQMQSRRYGSLLRWRDESPPVRSAAWWAWANLSARRGGGALGDAYLVVRLEDLCEDPGSWSKRIVEFSGCDGVDEDLASLIHTPSSLGRWCNRDPGLVAAIETACRDALRDFNYL